MELASRTRLAVVVGLVLAAATLRAAEKAAPAPAAEPAPASDAAQAAAELQQHHRHHSGGLTRFVAMSLDTLGTAEPAKRAAIEKLQNDINAHMAPAREIEKGLLQTLAEGVAAGTTDKAKIDAALAKLTEAAQARHDADDATLNELHKLLSPAERTALVDKVEAHWSVWRKANDETNPAGTEHGGRIAELTEEVSLTPEQVTKVQAALKTTATATTFDPKRGEKRIHAFATAFVAPTFDAKSLSSKTGAAKTAPIAGQGSKRMAIFYETVTPILTAEQRTKLAGNLREHASYEPATAGK